MERPAKRQRAADISNQSYTVQQPSASSSSSKPSRQPQSQVSRDLGPALKALKPKDHLHLLKLAAAAHSDVAEWIANAYRDKEDAQVINFDHFSKEAWHELNTKYQPLSGSKQSDRVRDVSLAIEGMLRSILDRVSESSSYGTKFSGIETYRKIFKSTLMSEGLIPREVRKDGMFGWGYILVQLFDKFSAADKRRLVRESGGRWVNEKWQEICELADENFPAVDNLMVHWALGVIMGKGDDFEDGNYDNDDDDDDDDDDGLAKVPNEYQLAEQEWNMLSQYDGDGVPYKWRRKQGTNW